MYNKNKTITLKTFLMLSITSMMLVPGGIIQVHAALGDPLLEINNPTPEPADYFGRSVVGTTDGNILVGASSDNTGVVSAGSAYLFDGNDGSLLLTINNPTPDTSENFGYSVAGTVNGNILVGAYSDHTGATNTGSVYLFDGNDGSLLLTINNPTPEYNDNFGISVDGTVNGNILVGAHRDNTGANGAGSAYLFDGNDGSLLLTINNPTPESFDNFGRSVDGTVNGNILVGAHSDNTGASDTGSAYLFDGNDGSLLLTINNPTPEHLDWFGYSVAGTVNGNILVGAHWDDTSAFNAGSAYLFDGNDGSLLLTINNPRASGDYFGYSVAGTVNGNILVGTDNSNFAYLFDGNDGSLLLTMNNPTESGDYFGSFVAGTINGSIIVGAWHNGDGSSAGSAYLFEGILASTPIFCGQPESYYDNIIEGTSGADYLVGTDNADLILGYAGNDFIRGMKGNDCIYAGTGNDFIQGGRGADTIYAGSGDDVVRTGFGNDIVYGEDGNDILHAVQKTGSNILDGGNGDFDICVPQNNEVIITTINCEVTS